MPDDTPAPTTTAPPADELDAQTAADVDNLRALTAEIADRKARADEIKARLRERVQPGRRYSYGGRTVLDLGKPGQQFDAKLAAQIVPPELHLSVSVVRFDPDLCRRILPADLYARCCTEKAPAVKPL